MRTLAKAVAVTSVIALALTGCGRDEPTEPAATEETAEKAFPADSIIGVSLPQKTSENWVLAENLFNDGLAEAGFEADVQFANGGVSEQQNQIQSMVTKGAKVIVVGAIDGSQLGSQLEAAKDSGAVVLAYDRLVKETEAVDYYVAYDNFEVGVLQGNALLEGMAAKKPEGPYNIELFAGSPDDANAQVFFDGAMSVLQPKIDDGTLVVTSGQTDFNQVVTQGWKAENAQKRMDTLMTGSYTSAELRRCALAQRHPCPGSHALRRGRREAQPGRDRAGLRGRVGQVDHGRRAVLDDQQGHPRPGCGDHRDGAGVPEG